MKKTEFQTLMELAFLEPYSWWETIEFEFKVSWVGVGTGTGDDYLTFYLN